jgi:hypothetical protein
LTEAIGTGKQGESTTEPRARREDLKSPETERRQECESDEVDEVIKSSAIEFGQHILYVYTTCERTVSRIDKDGGHQPQEKRFRVVID